MQAYGHTFARVYNKRWTAFAHRVAPLIAEYYASTPIGRTNRSVLDVCCGTGQLALHFLERGYRVTGLDLSEHMLQYAIENASAYVEEGRARFLRTDATQFSLDEQFGLVVSTFDALNHLDGELAFRQCLQSVFAILVDGGILVFDLNTRAGLMGWNNISVYDGQDAMIVTRGLYDGHSNRAYTRLSGFIRVSDGLYERFEETVFNTVFDLSWVHDTLLEIGWQHVHCARIDELTTPLDEPEREGRVFFVAFK
jgi:SAM-dependent methyltransferase